MLTPFALLFKHVLCSGFFGNLLYNFLFFLHRVVENPLKDRKLMSFVQSYDFIKLNKTFRLETVILIDCAYKLL